MVTPFAGAALSLSVASHALADDAKITVFAAASLTNAMQDIATQYQKKHVDVVSSFASSSTLARQIEARSSLLIYLFLLIKNGWIMPSIKKPSIRPHVKLC